MTATTRCIIIMSPEELSKFPMKAADYTAPKSISVGVVIFCCLKVVLGCTGM